MAIRNFLKKQTSIPESIEKQLPEGAPKVSTVLSAIANSLPSLPTKLSSATSKSSAPKLREFITSIEEKMPGVLPKFAPKEETTTYIPPQVKGGTTVTETPQAKPIFGRYGVSKRGTITPDKETEI